MFFESMKSTLVRAVAGAISGALILGGVAIAPAAQAVGGVDQATSNFQMFSTPAVEYQEQALSTGASAEPLFNAGLQRIAGRTTFRAIFGAAPNRQISQYQMGLRRCSNASDVANCDVDQEAAVVTRTLNPGLVIAEDLDVDIVDGMYGDIYRGQLLVDNAIGYVTPAYLAVMRQPRTLLPPMVLRDGVDAATIDLSNNDLTISLRAWTNLPETNERPRRNLSVWACPTGAPSQVRTYEWDSSECTRIEEANWNGTAARDFGPGGYSNTPERVSLPGQYLVVEDTLKYGSLVNGGAHVTVRSHPYLIEDSEAASTQQGQQPQQGTGQQQNQGTQTQTPIETPIETPTNTAAQATAAQPTGAAALRLRVDQAPVVSTTGVGSVDGTTLTVRSPSVQKKGKRKKSYRAIVNPRYKGRVAFVLTRSTPKGAMIVAKSKVKNTNKKGKAKIRWKFAKRKPTGEYTLYVSFIPKKRYGKPGLTVSKTMRLR
ncbi:MAG: hypothetical protein K0U51_02240 [Actinomycetia bacterium]|nr:hypothetical protein [Actinomycetes bacterium]MCH9706415.1 hypothetical protein [Actinomycetes bacterium]MCH9850353.1 hypothetical protein [Actinomycetes bacterium]